MLGRRLVALQICGMTVVVAGLMISSLDNDLDSEDGKRVALGSILIAGGTMAYGLEYAVCERLMAGGHAERAAGGSGDDDSEKRAAANEAIVEMMWYMGLWGTLLSAIYTVAYVVPRWDEMVGDRIEASGASPGWLAFLAGGPRGELLSGRRPSSRPRPSRPTDRRPRRRRDPPRDRSSRTRPRTGSTT